MKTAHSFSSNPPQIDLIPLQSAVSHDRPTHLDLLIKITPPALPQSLDRPPLNLGFVIDRSGSMSGHKIEYARQAAQYAIEQLLPTDRVSITIFDDRIETIVPTTLASHKASILAAIQGIHARGSTALHAGWVEGGIQVGQHLRAKQLNRVLLVSDGLANVGETNPDVIAGDVHGLAQRGISTTTLGVGNDYSEDLLEAMARSGDGNFYHIESPDQLPTIFQAELQGLMATFGKTVSLGIEPQNGAIVADVLNDLDKTSYGRLKLPNLVAGNSIFVVIRLNVPALSGFALNQETDLCRFRLAWNAPNHPKRQTLHITLRLPVLSEKQRANLPLHPEVQEQIALLTAARARTEAIQEIDRGDVLSARQRLANACDAVFSAPTSDATRQEISLLRDLEDGLSKGDSTGSRKKALYQRYSRQRSQPLRQSSPDRPLTDRT